MLNGPKRWYALAVLIVVLDQFSKLWIEHSFKYGEVLPVLPGFNLVLVYNLGAAFNFLSDAGGWQRYLFTALALIVAGGIAWLLRKHHAQPRFAGALALIMGGALGNVIDRMAYGHVIDFIQVYYQNHFWPSFNIADSAICVGAGLMVLDSFMPPKQQT